MLSSTRRGFLAGSAAMQITRAAAGDKLKAGLIGVGGRGRGAVVDLLTGTENVEVTTMADLFEDQLEKNLAWLKNEPRNAPVAARVNVAPDRRFTGFDAYQKLIASDVDIVMLCTPPGYRPMHFEAAVAAKKHVFCEKPTGTDPVGVRRFMDAAKKSQELKLTVVCGAQRRFQKEYIETIDKIRNGVIGNVVSTACYWMSGPVIKQTSRNPSWGDMEWQHRNWYSYVWLCGDQIVEQHMHNIDVICWLLNAHPISVVASGGASWRPRDEVHGNIYDHISADFTFADGVHMFSNCRQFPGRMYSNVSELAIGTKGRSNCRDLGTKGEPPMVAEHRALAASVRGDGPYVNNAMAVAESTMTCIMARESAYSGQELTWDMMMESKLDLMPKAFGYKERMTMPPLPVPGQYKFI
ncbi:MAG: Gfo/Idh/MocA family oxidoreductase [Acidobacteria bacterium]|nr:Gfo/Idh/MocA family oxidoreductase [Acidobacteriota bacterium]